MLKEWRLGGLPGDGGERAQDVAAPLVHPADLCLVFGTQISLHVRPHRSVEKRDMFVFCGNNLEDEMNLESVFRVSWLFHERIKAKS